MKIKNKLAVTVTSILISASSSIALSANISADTSSNIVSHYQQQSFTSFNEFITRVATNKNFSLASNINRYLQGATLSSEDQSQIFRLLGIYSQMKYGSEAIETLRELVAIPTYKTEGIPSHKSPAMLKLGSKVEALAGSFGLEYNNIDDRVFVVNIPKNTAGANVALHAHADVVPVNPSSWVLEDGTKLDPFKLTTIGNRMYGRGTEDDKNGIVATLYAMRVIKEEGLELANHFKLLIDTTEESGAEAIPYYLERYPTSDYNLALDGGYPVVIAEKGYGTLMATFPVRTVKGKGPFVTGITGGLATNQIPKKSIATIDLSNDSKAESNAFLNQLNKLADVFVAKHGGNFSINATSKNNIIELAVTGTSAHSSEPGSGVNPVSRMLMFIDHIQNETSLKMNHITDAANYAVANFGLDYHGKQLAVDYADEFMGPLTMALTFIDVDDKNMRLAVNLRAPKGKATKQLQGEISSKLDHWVTSSGINMSYTHEQRDPMFRDPKGKWINALLDVATENLNLPREFQSSGGATSIHDLPNGVQFGLAMPNEKYTGHNANEFKRVDQFMLDLRIVTEIIAKLGSMEQL